MPSDASPSKDHRPSAVRHASRAVPSHYGSPFARKLRTLVFMHRFGFEHDMYETLEFMPLDIRRRSDMAGVRISLAGWQALAFAERLTLGQLSVDTEADLDAYRLIARAMMNRVEQPMKEEHRATPWRDAGVTTRVAARARELGFAFEPAGWGALSDSAKYALYRLADSKKDPSKLEAALAELLPSA